MSAEQMRKEFEEWFFAVEGFSLRSERFADSKECAWAAWQAALSTQPQVPQGAVTPIFETRLRAVLGVIQDHLPPGGISEKQAISRIISLVDPWPAAPKTETPEGEKQ